MSHEFIGVIYALLAGLAIGLGCLVSIIFKNSINKYIYLTLGFSAGIMIYAGFMEVLPHGVEHLSEVFEGNIGGLLSLLGFVIGALLATLMDRLVPHSHHHHHLSEEHDHDEADNKSHIFRLGVLTAIAIGIHNFLEGMAIYVSFLGGSSSGIALTMSVAMHNIPVGVAIALPIYYATRKVSKAFGVSILSALATPLGALFSHFFIKQFLSDGVLGFIFSIVGGMMIYIAFDEMLPTANKYGDSHKVVYGVMAGMIVMGLSLILLGHGGHAH